jgi:hypothetical protein
MIGTPPHAGCVLESVINAHWELTLLTYSAINQK